MNAPTPAVRRLSQRLLLIELERETAGADGQQNVTAVAAAAERAAQKLQHPLSRLVGVAGYQALLARALNLAAREWPILDGVRPGATPSGGLDGLRQALQGAATDQAGNALASLLSHLVWLLVTFIGDDLARHTVRDAWLGIDVGDDALPVKGASITDCTHSVRPPESQRGGEGRPGGAEATT